MQRIVFFVSEPSFHFALESFVAPRIFDIIQLSYQSVNGGELEDILFIKVVNALDDIGEIVGGYFQVFQFIKLGGGYAVGN